MPRFRIDAPGFSVSVAAECSATLERIERYLLPWLPRVDASSKTAEVDIVLRRGSARDSFDIALNGIAVSDGETFPYLFTLIQQAADDAMIRSLQGHAVVHAGVVVHCGRAIIVAGSSGSGKSLLVRELLRQGAEYCSDEYAVLDRSGFVHPYPRALMIRGDSTLQHPVLASDLCAKVCGSPSPVSLFLFLRYDAKADGLELHPLDRSESVIRLLQNCPQIMADSFDMLDPLKQAVSSAASYEGIRGAVSQAAAEILRLVSDAP